MRLISIGDLMFEVVVHASELARPGDEAPARFTVRPGGQALNVARAFGRLGGDATLVAALGDDEWGNWLVRAIAQDNIQLRKQLSTKPTGMVVSIAAGRERTMYAQRGANADLDLSSLDLWSLNFDNSNPAEVILYLSGYLLSTGRGQHQVRSLLQQPGVRQRNTALDTPPFHILENIGRHAFLSNIEGVHTLFTTLDEGRFLAQKTSLESVASTLQTLFDLVVVKLGGEGCWVQTAERGQLIPTTPLDHIDATGAGDAFCGAFLYGVAQGGSAFEAAAQANKTAGAMIAQT